MRKQEKEWYENIPPQGVLCWVWDSDNGNRYPEIIIGYIPDGEYKFTTGDSKWRYARPMRRGEVEKYMLKGETS